MRALTSANGKAIRYKTRFCYIDARLEPAEPPASTNSLGLCRLRHLDHDRWSLAVYSYAQQRYEPSGRAQVMARGELQGELTAKDVARIRAVAPLHSGTHEAWRLLDDPDEAFAAFQLPTR